MAKNRKLLTHNAETILKLLLIRLGIPYSSVWEKEHEKHPDYPSFLSFYLLLKKYGIESAVLRPDFNLLKQLPTPFLIHIRPNGGMFLLIDHLDDEQLYFINEKNNLETNPIEYIKDVWSGYVLIFDKEEINYNKAVPSISQQIIQWLTDHKFLLAIVIFTIIILGLLVSMSGNALFFRYLFYIWFLIGLAISILLLIRLFDKYNPFIQKLCHSTKSSKTDCSSVLDSNAAYLWGIFSWSEIGFIYFFYLSWAILIGGSTGLSLAVICSILSFPYVFYSIGYQIFISKKWCRLCLSVQAVLTASFITALFAWKTIIPETWSIKMFVWFILTGLGTSFIYILIKPLVTTYLRHSILEKRYLLIKHTPIVKESLFSAQPEINPFQLERIILFPAGKQSITAIINTTCQPCMREIKQLMKMFQNKTETRLELIFFLKEGDERAMNAAIYLWEYYKNNSEEQFIHVLTNYAETYPNVSILNKKQNDSQVFVTQEIIKKQQEWCYAQQITSTPQLLFNYKIPPYFYNISDLDYMCY